MKKVIMAVIIFVLMAGTATAFTMKNEPLGWSGWAWGTPLQEVQGWLGYAGNLSIPQLNDIGATLFVRQGEPNNHFGAEWKATYYIFKQEKLCGVLLETDKALSAASAIVNYKSNSKDDTYIQGPEVKGKGLFVYAIAKGTYASYLQINDPSTGLFRQKYYVIIGSAPVANEWIDAVMATIP